MVHGLVQGVTKVASKVSPISRKLPGKAVSKRTLYRRRKEELEAASRTALLPTRRGFTGSRSTSSSAPKRGRGRPRKQDGEAEAAAKHLKGTSHSTLIGAADCYFA